jgi:signal transduction histidine kinase
MEPSRFRRGWGGRGLKGRIVLLTLVGTLAPSAILGWLSFQSVRDLQRQVLAEREYVAKSVATYVDSQVKTELQLLDEVSVAPGVVPENPPPAARSVLRGAYLRSRFFERVFLLNLEGQLLMAEPASSGGLGASFKDLPSVHKALGDGVPTVSDLGAGPDGTRQLYLLVPVRNWQGRIIGLVGGSIVPGSERFRSLLSFVPLDPGEAVDLVDEHGVVIASTMAERLFLESDHRHFIQGLIRDQSETAGTCHGCHESGKIRSRVNEVMAFVPLSPRVPWGIDIRQPEKLAFSTALALRWKIFAWATALTLLALLFAIGAAASITAPLSVLTRVATLITAGDLKTPIPELGSDEVGQLAVGLESMRVALTQSLDEVAQAREKLELRVLERTREIEQLYRQLSLRDELRAKLLQKLISAQEEERRRIARELHDETSQVVIALALALDAAMATMPPGASRERLTEAKALALRMLDGIRSLCFDLRPSVLDDLGLFPAIGWYAEHTLKPLGVAVHCEFDETTECRLPAQINTALFRAAQEAITNVAKHASAETMLIQCTVEAKAITIEIEDDGRGFDPAGFSSATSDGRGLGLAGIKERVELLGGSARIESAPGQGTRVVLTVPLGSEHG